MMIKVFLVGLVFSLSPFFAGYSLVLGQSAGQEPFYSFDQYERAVNHAGVKLRQTLEELHFDSSLHPSQTDAATGKWDENFMLRREWTSGFFPGSMWILYDLTGESFWKDHAKKWTEALESKAYRTEDHDTGFRILPSFGKGYEIIGGRYYHRTIIQAAHTLAQRYDPGIGAIKSWDWFGTFPVIIDNMMNLELLLLGADLTGYTPWQEMAIQHAETSIRHLKRPDASFYHVVDFDKQGNVRWKGTVQGFGEHSAWARGQAWAIYGFTMMYRFTNNPHYLEVAEATAGYFISQLPEDKIPIYDFRETVDASKTKDASAAAIAASAFLELYTFTNNAVYHNTAVNILHSLSGDTYSTYHSPKSSILSHTTIKRDEAHLGTVYADYYYLEAIQRYKMLNSHQRGAATDRPEEPIMYLDQNYPNPFNNTTRIYYSIEEEGPAKVAVYDLHGRQVQELVNRHHQPGTYHVQVDASGLASGVYLYRLVSNQNEHTRKMILLK